MIDGAGGLEAARGFELREVCHSSAIWERVSGGFRVRRAPGDGDIDVLVDLAKIERARCRRRRDSNRSRPAALRGPIRGRQEVRGCDPSWRCRRI